MSRPCDYSESSQQPGADDFAVLKQKITDLEARLDGRRSDLGWHEPIRSVSRSPGSTIDLAFALDASAFPPMFFLDAEVFGESNMTIVKPNITVPAEVANTLGTSILDIQDVVDRYFANIHTWLPFISKKRMELTLSNPGLELSLEFALLLLAMKLIIQIPSSGSQSVRSPLYALTKRYFAMVESSGIISCQTLQASILISAYEIGHAIYPAAYLTTGHSARLGHALGLNDRDHAPQIHKKKASAWAEVEEVRRTWWAVMLLDRYVNLGSRGHPLATDDPARNDMLPADDTMWDAGEMTTSEPLYVSTPTNVRAGPFARTCQATHLLGRLVRLLDDNLLDSPVRFTEALQLHRTIQALANLVPTDVQLSPERYGTSIALCYSSLIHLCDPFACTASNRGDHTVEETEMQTVAIAGMRATANDTLQFSKLFKRSMTQNPSSISPLVADCLYMAAATYAWLVHESGSREAAESYHSLRGVLEMMNCRWAVAAQYLAILNKAQETMYPQTLLLVQPIAA
jgi:hypothetical protein